MYNSWTFYSFNSLTSFDIYAFAQKVIRIIHILIETNPHRIEQNIVVNATSRNRNDFSVPAWPVRMMLCPSRIRSSANICSQVKEAIILDVDTIRCKNFRPIKCVTNATEDFRRIRRVRWMVHCAFLEKQEQFFLEFCGVRNCLLCMLERDIISN